MRTLGRLARFCAAKALRRKLLFLPLNQQALLPLRYTYRASPDGQVRYRLLHPGTRLIYSVHTVAYGQDLRWTPGPPCLSFSLPAVKAGDVLEVNLVDLGARHNDRPIPGAVSTPHAARKFVADLELADAGKRLWRRCAHYLPFEGKAIGRDYYFGDDYVDYPKQSQAVVRQGVDLVRQYCPGGRLLEIGCALGFCLEAFLEAGFDAHGVDLSEFAVAEARKRVGDERVQVCNVDLAPLPFASTFDVFFLWDVLEHSANPAKLLAKLSERATPGSWVFVHIANAESVTHRVLEADWEAYSDYSHYGVEQVSASNVRAWLGELGWEIVKWQCQDIWVDGADPVILQLGTVFQQVPELAALLAERDQGDFLQVVARKR